MEQTVRILKKDLRKMLKSRLGNLPNPYRRKASLEIFQQVEQMPVYIKSTAIFCYLAMPQEVQTRDFIERCLMEGKRIFVPKVLDGVGSHGRDMQVLEVVSLEDMDNFPKSKWGIPEPPADLSDDWKSNAYSCIDLVIVPGVGFDQKGQRIGHGKGYYDTFFASYESFCQENGQEKPTLLGVSFEEQLVEEVPTSEHDKRLDYVVTPSDIYSLTTEVDNLLVPPDSISTRSSAQVDTEYRNKREEDTKEVASFSSSESSAKVENNRGWAQAFVVATKVGEEGDGCLVDFMPNGGSKTSDFGGFRQPNSLASFMSRQTQNNNKDMDVDMEDVNGNRTADGETL